LPKVIDVGADGNTPVVHGYTRSKITTKYNGPLFNPGLSRKYSERMTPTIESFLRGMKGRR